MRRNPIVHHLLNNAHPASTSSNCPSWSNPPGHTLSMACFWASPLGSLLSIWDIHHSLISLWLVLCWPCSLNGISCTSSLAEHRKSKSPWLRVSTTKQWLQHQCIINIILVLNPKYSTVLVMKKRISHLSQTPNSLSLYSWKRCPKPLVIFMALLWSWPIKSVFFLNCCSQNWTQPLHCKRPLHRHYGLLKPDLWAVFICGGWVCLAAMHLPNYSATCYPQQDRGTKCMECLEKTFCRATIRFIPFFIFIPQNYVSVFL